MRAVACTFALITTSAVAAAQPYRGSDALEPGLGGRSDILLFEDYELTDWQSHWTGAAGDFAASSDVVLAGQQSLVVRVPAGAHDGCSLEFSFAAAGLAEPEEIYFRYYVHFDSSWELSGDGEIGKLPGIAGTYGIAGWGGRPSDGTNGWSARMMNWDTGSGNAVGFYTYHADMTDTYGTHMRWMPDLERNRWYCIEAHARMNTISGNVGAQDGVLRGWIDGVTAFERTDLRFRDVDTLRIEQIWFNVYVGGSWVADHDMQLHFDNVVVARDRVGCMTTPADAGVEPPVDPLGDAGQGATSSGGGAGSGNTAGAGAANAGGAGAQAGSSSSGGNAGAESAGSDPDAAADNGSSGGSGSGDSGSCGCRVPRDNSSDPLGALGTAFVVLALAFRRAGAARKPANAR